MFGPSPVKPQDETDGGGRDARNADDTVNSNMNADVNTKRENIKNDGRGRPKTVHVLTRMTAARTQTRTQDVATEMQTSNDRKQKPEQNMTE